MDIMYLFVFILCRTIQTLMITNENRYLSAKDSVMNTNEKKKNWNNLYLTNVIRYNKLTTNPCVELAFINILMDISFVNLCVISDGPVPVVCFSHGLFIVFKK